MCTIGIKKFCFTAAILGAALSSLPALADEPMDIGDSFSKAINESRNTPSPKRWDVYLSGYAHHDRDTYSEAQLRKLNETTWGGGFGRTIRNERGNDESVYIMAIRDSINRPQWTAGYIYQWIFPVKSGSVEVGGGLTALVMRRSDWCNGHPFPAVLPVASIGMRNAKLVATYVPRIPLSKAKGNILQVMLELSI
jgi:palmitoyl transferase